MVILVALVIGVGAFLLTADDDGPAADATPVALEGADDPGPAPFTADAAESIDLARVRELADIPADIDEPDDGADDPTGTVRTGTDPGLYTAPEERPDLRSRPDRARPGRRPVDAGGLGRHRGVPPADVAALPRRRSPRSPCSATPGSPTTGTTAGRAVATQAILQAGTVVLVDDRGLPRVRCASGSPLLPPIAAADGITVERHALDRLLARPGADDPGRPAGGRCSSSSTWRAASRSADRWAPTAATTRRSAGATTTTTASTTTSSTSTSTTHLHDDHEHLHDHLDDHPRRRRTSPPTAAPPPPRWSTPSAPGLAIDGDTTTSWFGNGSSGAPSGSVFTWEHGDTLEIDRITVVGNGANADSALRTGTGFESVTVEVLDNGTVTYSETFGLPGTPDPTINARPAAAGNTVRLTFIGPEGTTAGGLR